LLKSKESNNQQGQSRVQEIQTREERGENFS
jgi:hypothetical protein